MWPDWINGSFELLGALLIWRNVRQLLRDTCIRGVDWRVTGFFAAWGLWNLLYYSTLDQWASFAGGIVLTVGNLTWVALAWKYRKR